MRLITVALVLCCARLALAAPTVQQPAHVRPHSQVRHKSDARRTKIVRKAGWAGAGLAAGQAAGPAGSAAVGAAKYRHDLKAGGERRTKAVAKIGGPIAAGAAAGPAGSAAYEAVEHRHWIKRHILHPGSKHSAHRS